MMVQCDNCSNEVDRLDLIKTADGDLICETCLEEDYYTCSDCGDVHHVDYGFFTDRSGWLCDACYSELFTVCDHCGEDMLRSQAIRTHNGEYICGDCFSDDYFECPDCEEIYPNDEGIYHERRDATLCSYCYSPSCLIGDYHSSKGSFTFRGGQALYYYGVELEIDDAERYEQAEPCALELSELSEALHFENDGSLNNGFEIITDPCSFAYHMDKLPWQEICETAEFFGYKSHDTSTCGLHIHISRTAFGQGVECELNLAKTLLLVDRLWPEIVTFSRRDAYKLDRWAKKPDARITANDSDESILEKLREKESDCRHGDRYQAVNLANRHTVEFRIFRGTLKPETVLASIQWVEVLVNYVRDHNLDEVLNASWHDIFGQTKHKELNQYMQERGLL